MAYWWNAFKFGGDVIRLTPAEAEQVMTAKLKGGSVSVPRLKSMIDTKGISEVEQSDEEIRQEQQYIGSGDTPTSKRELPIGYPKSAACRYVKRLVPFRTWERKFAAAPGYHLLHSDDESGDVWMAYTRIVTPSELDPANLPSGLKPLEVWEENLLNQKLGVRN